MVAEIEIISPTLGKTKSKSGTNTHVRIYSTVVKFYLKRFISPTPLKNIIHTGKPPMDNFTSCIVNQFLKLKVDFGV